MILFCKDSSFLPSEVSGTISSRFPWPLFWAFALQFQSIGYFGCDSNSPFSFDYLKQQHISSKCHIFSVKFWKSLYNRIIQIEYAPVLSFFFSHLKHYPPEMRLKLNATKISWNITPIFWYSCVRLNIADQMQLDCTLT